MPRVAEAVERPEVARSPAESAPILVSRRRMGLRAWTCYALSVRKMRPPDERTRLAKAYGGWRHGSLARSWSSFSDAHVDGKDVLDFGCGEGQLSLFLARTRRPRLIVGVDLLRESLERARADLGRSPVAPGVDVAFEQGSVDGLPCPDGSFDTLLAFDCLEHVMDPAPILRGWHRVLRPGGRCLIEWYPFKGPWGPHMESLVPIPWAHVIFGEEAMFRTAERIYDRPDFSPRLWDLDDAGRKLPNKWRQWASFREQGYVNQLDLPTFRRLATAAGFRISRLELRGWTGSPLRTAIGTALMCLPFVGERFVSHAIIELERLPD